MSVTFGIVAVVGLVAVCGLVLLALEMGAERVKRQARFMDDRRGDLDSYVAASLAMVQRLTDAVCDIPRTEDAVLRAVLDALIADRNRLLSAALIGSGDRAAALTLAQVDRASPTPAVQPTTVADLMRDLHDAEYRDAAASAETVDSEGRPIIPVGFGG